MTIATQPDARPMSIEHAINLATRNGWRDDTAWTHSKIRAQISSVADGLLSAVRVLADGTIDWRVSPTDDHSPAVPHQRHGTAPNIREAIAACNRTVAAATATLF